MIYEQIVITIGRSLHDKQCLPLFQAIHPFLMHHGAKYPFGS